MKERNNKLTNNEICSFCGQLSMILKSGVSLMEGLSIMMEDATGSGRDILTQLYDGFNQTGYLADALETTDVFPKYMVNMVRLGETAGKLDTVMDALEAYYQREEDIARGIKGAITYPAIMVGMMIIIVVVLMVQVMPIFNQVFIQLGTEMTGFGGGILAAGQVISRYAIVFIILLAILLAVGLYFAKSKRGRATMRQFATHFVLTRKVNEKIALARFAGGLSMTISSGLDGQQGLAMVDDITEHPALKEKIAVARGLMNEGTSFAPALHEAGIFSGLNGKLLAIGDKSGSLDTALDRIARQYNDDVDTAIDGMLSILEPTLVAILSIIVGLILLSVMFPLLGIMSSIG